MMLRMAHPQHGETHVYDEQHKVLNEKNGWKVIPEPGVLSMESVNSQIDAVLTPKKRKQRERTPEERAAWGAKMKAAREAKKNDNGA